MIEGSEARVTPGKYELLRRRDYTPERVCGKRYVRLCGNSHAACLLTTRITHRMELEFAHDKASRPAVASEPGMITGLWKN
jgi:hypothetical protein